MPILGLELIDQLGLSADSYVILGSAAAIAHGLEKTNGDLDILVQEPIGIQSLGILDIGDGLFDGSLSKEAIFADSVLVNGYRVMGLASLCEFYRTLSGKNSRSSSLSMGGTDQSLPLSRSTYGDLTHDQSLVTHKHPEVVMREWIIVFY